MRVFIKTIADKVLHLELDPENTMSEVKTHIREADSIPEYSQRLIYKG